MFHSRGERDTSIEATGCTTDKVGPGSYSVLLEKKVVPSTAPFASKAPRPCVTPTAFARDGNGSASIGATKLYDLEHAPAHPSHGSFVPSSEAKGSTLAQDGRRQPSWRVGHTTSSSSFASGTERFRLSKEAISKPGPGTYSATAHWPRVKRLSVTSAGLQRQDNSTTAAALQRTAAMAAAAAGGAGVPVLTAPSIPARHQAYGYETGQEGILWMQPMPAADASNSVQDGGSCNAAHGRSGTHWSASKTERLSATYVKEELSPRQHQQPQHTTCCRTANASIRAPQTAHGRTEGSRGSISTAGSAAFASRVSRLHQMVPNPDHATPGPGSYGSWDCKHHRPGSAPATAGPSPAHQQLFGRVAGRQECVGGLSWGEPPASSSPGPGSYNVPTALSKAIKRSWAVPSSAQASAARKQAPDIEEAAVAVTAGFGSTCSRFENPQMHSPGPGRYVADHVMSLSADVARRTAAARTPGGFGSAADRFGADVHSHGKAPCAQLAAMPFLDSSHMSFSPAQATSGCDEADKAAAHQLLSRVQLSPGFASASKRFAPSAALPTAPDYSSWDGEDGTLRGDATRLGPGLYHLQDGWTGKPKRSSSAGGQHMGGSAAPFGTCAARRGMAPAPGMTPGPGAYSNAAKDMHQIFRPLSVPETNRASFSAGSRRFATSSTPTPGPGAYSPFVPDGSSTLLKPSFNVTAGH